MRRLSRGASASPLAGRSAAAGTDPMSLIRTFNSETNPSRPIHPSPLTASQIRGMPLDLIDRIRSFPLFQSTPEGFLAEIGLHLRPQINSPNDYILTEGDDAKAMYWLVRGAVSVTSRDGESVYAELNPGAFFGEIGILMDRPRTATIIARTRCLLVVLTKEDFKNILPRFPEVERAIREEAEERLQILAKKKSRPQPMPVSAPPERVPGERRGSKRLRESFQGGLGFEDERRSDGKKRKSPSPGLAETSTSSALANGLVNVRMLLRELPLFAQLPAGILHFLGLNAQPRAYDPFTDIITEGSQGREIYFIVRGEVEVIKEPPNSRTSCRGADAESVRPVEVKARLRQGQYFGEVVSLSLAPRRTATVRSVTAVECLMISSEVLSKFWELCPKEIKEQVERTARQRLDTATTGDIMMEDAPPLEQPDSHIMSTARRQSMPMLTLTESDPAVLKPLDPDPYLSVDLDNMRSRSRRGSLAPVSDEGPPAEQPSQPSSLNRSPRSASPSKGSVSPFKPIFKESFGNSRGVFADNILVSIFQHLELHHLFQLRAVSRHWSNLITKSPDLLHFLDLSIYNRKLTDDVITELICPFIGDRPRAIDLNNCFHLTDEGFNALANSCGANLRALKMKSVWDVTAPAILDMANRAKELEEIDLSNCRKVSDTLLARIVGWLVPGNHPLPQMNGTGKKGPMQTPIQTPAGAVFGCPELKKLTLSYCKHVTDRSMHHIAAHAASRLEEVDLTRCTTITDQGFQYWGNAQFFRLKKLCLADCTYLTDNAIVYLTTAAKSLQELDLSFCCALSDTATEVIALGCPQLTHLNLSFCGSAVSDSSLRSVSLHLILLRSLSVRGCVRVTGAGVDSVVEGCTMLNTFDVSQCKNLTSWVKLARYKKYGEKINFITVAHSNRVLS